MKAQLFYLVFSILAIPFLPFLWWKGQKLKAKIPVLPEAKGKEGQAGPVGSAIQVLTLGESTIAGVGVAHQKEGISGQVAQALHQTTGQSVRWQVVARSGYTANQVKDILLPEIPENKVDLLLIGLGANDAFALNSPLRWKKDMTNLIQQLRQQQLHCPIVIANMPPIGDFPAFPKTFQLILGTLVSWYGQATKELSQQLVNVHYMEEAISFDRFIQQSSTKIEKSDFFSDGVHPSEMTYAIWGQEIADFIRERGLVVVRD